MKHEKMVVLTVGGPQAQTVARRVRECDVFCEVLPANITPEKLKAAEPKGIIITGSFSDIPLIHREKLSWVDELGVPVLEVGQGAGISVEALSGGKGKNCLNTFLKNTCEFSGDWSVKAFIDESVEQIREQVGDGKVLLGLSGGVDSSVLAALLSKAVGDRLICIFVDTGLMRKNEGDQIEAAFKDRDLTFVRVNAETKFLFKLVGVSDPEKKRKIIGEEFIRVFESEAAKFGDAEYLAQGTIYPDIIESGARKTGGKASTIKSHHNLIPFPEGVHFDLIEPLDHFFKDEVRALGIVLGLPDHIVYRQPFPGPGLAIRIIGAVDAEKIEMLKEADAIVREEIDAYNERLFEETGTRNSEHSAWQYFAVLPDVRSVGVMGDERTYQHPIIVRAVESQDAMTADWAKLPYEVLGKISTRIVGEVNGINRVAYDITSKPPATIEWE